MPPSKISLKSEADGNSDVSVIAKGSRGRRRAFGTAADDDEDADFVMPTTQRAISHSKAASSLVINTEPRMSRNRNDRSDVPPSDPSPPRPRGRSRSRTRNHRSREDPTIGEGRPIKPVSSPSIQLTAGSSSLTRRTRSGRLVKPPAVFSTIGGAGYPEEDAQDGFEDPMMDAPLGPLELHHTHHQQTAGRRPGGGGSAGDDGEGSIASPACAAPVDWRERWNMALLVLLYMMQGIPLGLTTGAM